MQAKSYSPKLAAFLPGLLGLFLLVNCSTTAPKSAPAAKASPAPLVTAVTEVPVAKPAAVAIQEDRRPAVVCANDEARVKVEVAEGVEIDSSSRSQIAEQIQQRLDAKKGLNGIASHDRHYEVTVTLTRFHSGSALGRLLSGKTWQVDIDSTVSVRLLPTGEKLNEFTIRENFSRGGLGGLATSYTDAAMEFADGVAVALTGRASPRPTSNEWTLR